MIMSTVLVHKYARPTVTGVMTTVILITLIYTVFARPGVIGTAVPASSIALIMIKFLIIRYLIRYQS